MLSACETDLSIAAGGSACAMHGGVICIWKYGNIMLQERLEIIVLIFTCSCQGAIEFIMRSTPNCLRLERERKEKGTKNSKKQSCECS